MTEAINLQNTYGNSDENIKINLMTAEPTLDQNLHMWEERDTHIIELKIEM